MNLAEFSRATRQRPLDENRRRADKLPSHSCRASPPATPPANHQYLATNMYIRAMRDLSAGNYETLRREAEDDAQEQRDVLCLWAGRLGAAQHWKTLMATLPELTLGFNAIPA